MLLLLYSSEVRLQSQTLASLWPEVVQISTLLLEEGRWAGTKRDLRKFEHPRLLSA